MATATVDQTISRARLRQRVGTQVGHWALPAFTVLAIGYLLIPIAVMIVFSFNDYRGKFNFIWQGFTLNAWLHPLDWPGLPDALRLSLTIAFLSTLGATILGTLIGLALSRYPFRGRGAVNGLIFLPMASPEIVLGASLLTMFVNIGLNTGFVPPGLTLLPKGTLTLGFGTILIAHIMFNISYVVVTVKARVAGFDRRL
jgi:spermidine/putrescine transport system permease protein